MKTAAMMLCAVGVSVSFGAGVSLGVPLTGAGSNLAVPSPNLGAPLRQGAALSPGGGSFTGTWTAPALPDWIGTFSADGPIPAGQVDGPGLTRYDFTALPTGVLPVGSYFAFGDLDGGSATGETFILQAFDTSGFLITWLDEPFGASGSGTGPGLSIVAGNMPGWEWDAGTGTYTFTGTTFGGNPSITVWLENNTAIERLAVERTSDFANFSISAPIPSPGSAGVAMVALGLAARRRRGG